MDLEAIYQNIDRRDTESTTGAQTQSHSRDEEKDLKHRGSRRLVLISVGLGLICVLLLVFIILLNITITAERDMTKSYKNTVEEFNRTINSLQYKHTDLTQKNLELETKVKDLTAEKNQLQRDFDSLNKKNLVLETRVKDLTAEKSQLQRDLDFLNKKGLVNLFMSTELSWSDSRQYCRDRGADLVIINTEEKQRFISSLVSERVWIGLSDTENEGVMKWVDNSPLKQGFWFKDQPNNYNGNQDCIELNYEREKPGWSPLNSWNDFSCSVKKKGICEK
ncbi:C-type lectin domain family 4 member A-like [Carassius auratus]|uniref:C-type lectin domain family 4 member A-like n=1 Tax=Carassius auratus TaxID=7957 RepID=A0A6P6Q7N7_CARAU|nr:C-type lectin domain family 4 member A-like [Carassius auratus]